MQFHVVVHCADEEGAAERLKQVLATVRITPDLLHRPGPDKSLLIKRRFTEAQAAKVRDQLVRLGLQSSILESEPQSKAPKPLNDNRLSPQTLKQVSQQIQGLFNAPNKTRVNREAPRFAALRSQLLCARIIARLLMEVLLALTACGLFIGVTIWLTTSAFSYSFLLGLLLTPLLFISVVNAGALMAFFAWPRKKRPSPRLQLKSHDDPRLFLFATAICQLVKAPQPSTIHLTMDGHVHAGLDRDRNGNARTKLEVGLPVLRTLSVAELGCVLAGECARYHQVHMHRSFRVIHHLRDYLRRYMERELELTALKHARLSLQSAAATEVLHKTLQTLKAGERWRIGRAQFHVERIDRLLSASSISKRARQLSWGGSTADLDDKINQLSRALYQHSRVELRDSLLIDQLAASVAKDCQFKSNPPQETGLVKSTLPADNLVKNLEHWDKTLSRLLYQSRDLDLKNFSLLGHDEVVKRRQQNKRYRKIADDYFVGWLHPKQFWQMPALDANKGEALQRLNRCVAQLRSLAPERSALIARQERLQHQVAELHAAKKVIASGGNFKFVHCPTASSADLVAATKAHESKLRECDEELFHQNSIMGERLMLGMALAQKHGIKTEQVLIALNSLAKMRPKLEKLKMELDQLTLLEANSSGMTGSSFATYQRELRRSIDSNYQFLGRQLERCPYGFCEPGMGSIGHLLQFRLQQHMPRSSSEKARLLLKVVDEAHERISQRAAGVATRIEHTYQIDRIRRLDASTSR